jgi:hypothetical protein
MNRCEWIVCERGSTWAAALRVAAARQPPAAWRGPRLYEVRSLAELSERFDVCPQGYGLVEVHRANLGPVLTWLVDTVRRFPRGCFAALLDASITGKRGPNRHSSDDRQEAVNSLLEAGAVDVADSPRHLQPILALGQRHCDRVAICPGIAVPSPSFAEWAQSLVPWQDS